MSGDLEVSVIIPAYNRCPLLERAIGSLLDQTTCPDEILVVHSGTDDPTQTLERKFSAVTVIHRDERVGAGSARNIASDHAKGKWLAFIDADVVPERDWLGNLLESVKENEKRIVGGAVDYLTTGGYWGLSLWAIEFSGVHPFLPDDETQGIGAGNLLMPREALERIGGFPSRFPAAEDTIVGAKAREIGYQRWFCAKARVRHMNLSGFRHFAPHLYRLGRHSAISRRAMPLKGRLAIRFWPLSPLLFVSKFAATYYRAMRWGRGRRAMFLGIAPGVLCGLVIWNLGVLKGLREAIPPLNRERELEQVPSLKTDSIQTSM